jgi:hypothetical protein
MPRLQYLQMNWKKEIITQHSRIVEVVVDEEINEGQQLKFNYKKPVTIITKE